MYDLRSFAPSARLQRSASVLIQPCALKLPTPTSRSGRMPPRGCNSTLRVPSASLRRRTSCSSDPRFLAGSLSRQSTSAPTSFDKYRFRHSGDPFSTARGDAFGSLRSPTRSTGELRRFALLASRYTPRALPGGPPSLALLTQVRAAGPPRPLRILPLGERRASRRLLATIELRLLRGNL